MQNRCTSRWSVPYGAELRARWRDKFRRQEFVVAVVMLALAVGVQSSLYTGHYAPAVSYVTSAVHPAAHWGHSGPALWGGPLGHGAGHYGPAAVAVHAAAPWGHSGPAHWGGYPGISLSQGPAHGALAIAAPLAHGHGHEGVYVAKTRGAVHTAPLAGHINSATSLNLAAAPGTH